MAQSRAMLPLSIIHQLDARLGIISKKSVTPEDLEAMISETEQANDITFTKDELDSIYEALEFMGVEVKSELDPFAIKPGRYRHFKGNEYEVIGIAKDSENLEPLVVYRALYGKGDLWVRPASMWAEYIERDGYKGPRFEYLGE